MNEIESDEIQDRVPRMFGGMNAKDLVKPKAGCGEVPEADRNVN
jgi:hypothetical protein